MGINPMTTFTHPGSDPGWVAQHQGMIAVSQVAMDGQPVVAEMIEDGTGLRVVLPAHLPPGQEVEVAMRFNVTLPVVRTATRCLGGRMTSSACPASIVPWSCTRRHRWVKPDDGSPKFRRSSPTCSSILLPGMRWNSPGPLL